MIRHARRIGPRCAATGRPLPRQRPRASSAPRNWLSAGSLAKLLGKGTEASPRGSADVVVEALRLAIEY